MKRARVTEEQTIGLLKEQEAGAKAANLARRRAVSEAMIYNGKAKYGELGYPRQGGRGRNGKLQRFCWPKPGEKPWRVCRQF
jgi:putative transposase